VAYVFADGPLVPALRARGLRTEVLRAPAGVTDVRRSSGWRAALRAVPGVVGLARELARVTTPRDMLYANTQKSWIVAALVALAARRTVVWHLHDILSRAHFSRLLARVAVALANRCAALVIVNSATTGEAFVAAGGRRSLVRIVHNGIDVAPFDALTGGDDVRRSGAQAAPRPVTIGLFGRLSQWKGQHVLLEALRELDGVEALIVGDALFGEHAYRRRLRAIAAEPALAGRVRFLGQRADVPELMKSVDIVVHTSLDPEPFGRVIVEGMLAERPVIATRGGGVDEIIEDGVDGVLVPPNEPAALAAEIRRLCAEPALARRLAVNGRAKALRQFLLGTMQRRLATVLGEVVPAP
jgi:glycosyltransferase involved in cell wall biosynthesis